MLAGNRSKQPNVVSHWRRGVGQTSFRCIRETAPKAGIHSRPLSDPKEDHTRQSCSRLSREYSVWPNGLGEWLATCIGKNALVSERLQVKESGLMGTIACSVDKVSAIPVLPVEHKEASLIRQILGGRRDLFGDLIEPHVGALWRIVQARMRNDPDTDDIVQQAVFKAFTHLEQFRFEAGFRTWLIRIALNEVTQHWRKTLPSRWVALDGSAIAQTQVSDPKDSPFNVCARSQTARLLRIALASLPEKYRIVVRMRDLEERSISEVAERLCLTVAAVKTRHHRGRLRMAKVLSRTAYLQRFPSLFQ